jgi:PAS domain S-box-containing protein
MWIEMKEFARLRAFWRPNGNMASAESPVSHLNRGTTDDWTVWAPVAPEKKSDSAFLRYGAAGVAVVCAALITSRVWALQETPFLVFVGAIIISALHGGLGPGIFATALSAFTVSYFFVPPYYELSLRGSVEDNFRLGVFAMVALMASGLVAGVRRARREWQASEERYRSLAETASDAILIIDQEGTIVFVNPAAVKIFGYPAEQMLRQKLSLLIPEARYRSHLLEMKEDFHTRKCLLPLEVTGHHQSGREVPLEISFGPLSKHGSDVFMAIARDVTRRKEAEAALRQKEEELRDFVENASMGLHWVDSNGRILWSNQAEMDLLGYTCNEYIGHSIQEFHVDKPVIEDMLRRLKAKETLHNFEARLRCKDGSIKHVLVSSNVLWKNEEFVHTRCFTRDITERKQAEEARVQLATVVETSQQPVILVAEDNEIQVGILRDAFAKAELLNPVQVVKDGEDVIQYLAGAGQYADREKYPMPGLLLLDLKMPRKDGFEVLQWVRQQRHLRSLHTVVFSVLGDTPEVNRAYELGANSFLIKPVNFDDFVRIARALQVHWLFLSRVPTAFVTPHSPASK